ncbi:pilus assembly protein [Desulfobulbus alkaliphilus]|uniref:pilus assembly protein n=1 Tax=Desulfobulbus alkaliphilus TaxID=869814 RepID=UPI0019628120|nr:hypothetical protein [Desulfobulbus alkaliphilus]MBM9535543.1 hypothetical protein [Desulfobulbus alkaliphilus]
MTYRKFVLKTVMAVLTCISLASVHPSLLTAESVDDFSLLPPFVNAGIPPLVLLNVSNDNQLYFNAYPEYADLTGNGVPERGYTHAFDYYGYFDSYKCYAYDNSSEAERFTPAGPVDNDKYCSGGLWSGNFLNWLTMARIDTVRKILYGGYRSVDTPDLTVLERTYLPNDAHSWVRYYDGADLEQLSPFTNEPAALATSTSSIIVPDPPAGERNQTIYRRVFSIPDWTHNDVQLGDQLHIVSQDAASETWMRGVVRSTNFSSGTLEVQITSSQGAGETFSDWLISNNSRRGVSFCNTTVSSTTRSRDVTDPPLLRVARGDYSLWTANERWQCRWNEEESRTGHNDMRVGGINFSNGNDISASGLWSNSENPVRNQVGLGLHDYQVMVEVCNADQLGTEICKAYPNEGNDPIYKPVGLLQEFGTEASDAIQFGLMTGSYSKNLSGGVLRKNIQPFADEIDPQTGQIIEPASGESIVRSLDALRLYGYNHSTGLYENAGDNCGVGVRLDQMTDGRCMNWGNPQSELFAEALRYYAGLACNPDFNVTGTDRLPGLQNAVWADPLSDENWCAPLNVVQFNASFTSFDNNIEQAVSGLGFASGDVGTVDDFTNLVGAGENIDGQQIFAGGDNRLCTAEELTGLADFEGICPEAPNQRGTYSIAGLAHYAYTNSIRNNLTKDTQFVKTYGVSLAPAVPRIEIPRPGETVPSVVILPALENVEDGGLRGALADFRIIDQDIENGTGRFFIQWDVHEWGSDFDMDINGTLTYQITEDDITITTDVWSQSSSRTTGFGYIISGTGEDGFHAHSGINGYNGSHCSNCRITDAPTERTYTIGGDVALLLREPLYYAAKWGGYDKEHTGFPDDPLSWDRTGDGLPDNYFFATNPAALATGLAKVFRDILKRSSSGTAASVISSSRSGEGAIYQSLFYTSQTDTLDNTVHWTGQLHSLFVDAYGNMREDTNNNGILDMESDKIVVFSEDSSGGVVRAVAHLYLDADGTGILEEATLTDTNIDISELNFIWNSSDWLNNLQDIDLTINRDPYISNTGERYIITFIDNNGDMMPGIGDVKAFVSTDDDIIPYLHGLSPFDDTLLPTDLNSIRINDPLSYPVVLEDYLRAQRKRVIDYVRGIEQQEDTVTSNGYELTLPAMRSRQFDYNQDGTAQTWRLGDIVYSTPTVVATPAEDYDLLYRDSSYTDFYRKYRNRRNVIYVGANDGMLHAFNGGFYDRHTKGFYNNYNPFSEAVYENSSTQPELGAELWAYVPFNLLPHLYWLTEESYDLNKHVAFMDLKPRIFDAKVFPPSATHPNGWGTILVAGMRLGGGTLHADTNFDNSKTEEPVMRPAFVVMDITDPEQPPTILAELAFPDLGFTTSFPTVAIFKDRGDISPAPPSDPKNDWYLVIGSGPYDSNAGGARGRALFDATSDQPAKVYMIDLVRLARGEGLRAIVDPGEGYDPVETTGAESILPFASLDANAFVSDLVAVDFDLDYRADAIYFGTVSGNFEDGWGGKLRRLVFRNNPVFSTWDNDSVLIDLDNVHDGQPITAAPTISISMNTITGLDDRWVFFGTGRFFNRKDVEVIEQQTYYGIKEPVDVADNSFTWMEVNIDDLLDTSNARVFEGGSTVYTDYEDIFNTETTFDDLVVRMQIQDDSNADFLAGWKLNFTGPTERNIGQAALLGEILTFTTYLPSEDVCEIEGESNFYALYFTTGTAFKRPVIGLTGNSITEGETTVYEVARQMLVGRGMTITPSLHRGARDGSKAFLQTSTGGIFDVDIDNPGFTKSGAVSWEEERWD